MKNVKSIFSRFFPKFKEEYSALPTGKTPDPHQYYAENGAFPPVDADMLYCMIRHFKPKRIIEMGSGYSTRLSAQAILKNREINESYECELTAIEPYPSEILRTGFPGFSRLITDKVQNVSLAVLRNWKKTIYCLSIHRTFYA